MFLDRLSMVKRVRDNKSTKRKLAYCTRPKTKKPSSFLKGFLLLPWSHLGSNQGPPDYESFKKTFHFLSYLLNYLILLAFQKYMISYVFRFYHFLARMFDKCLT